MKALSNFTKQAIFDCYNILWEVAKPDNIVDEDFIHKTQNRINRYSVAIPSEIFTSIIAFYDKEILPFTSDGYFKKILREEYVEYLTDEIYMFRSEQAEKEVYILLCVEVIELENKIEMFGHKNIYPYLQDIEYLVLNSYSETEYLQ